VSWISRNSVKDRVTPKRPASPGTRQDGVHPTGQKSKKCPQVDGHVLSLRARHAKVRREGYRKGENQVTGLDLHDANSRETERRTPGSRLGLWRLNS